MNFIDTLVSIYCENPCQVLPNALWKTLAQIGNFQTAYRIDKDVVHHLAAWDERNLLVYWTRGREPLADFFQQQTDLNLALIHQDYLHVIPSAKFTIHKPYFRLIYTRNEPKVKTTLPTGLRIIDVNIQQEAQKVADLIGRCYPDLHPTVDTVTKWIEQPVFEPALWIWAIDDAIGIPVGLGIAEIDGDIQEGSLEWIQVLPEYRGRGVGKCIVQELLFRLEKWVKFTTVAGEVDNATHPEALYRSCGFRGSDIWWMFKA